MGFTMVIDLGSNVNKLQYWPRISDLSGWTLHRFEPPAVPPYSSFDEMTNASGLSAALTPADNAGLRTNIMFRV